MKHTIDAQNKKLGRVASEAAKLLIGKQTTDNVRNQIADVKVEIINAAKADIDVKKLKTKTYRSYSLYPGGDKEVTAAYVAEKKGMKQLFIDAVYGMLPINKLRSKIIQNLKVTD